MRGGMAAHRGSETPIELDDEEDDEHSSSCRLRQQQQSREDCRGTVKPKPPPRYTVAIESWPFRRLAPGTAATGSSQRR